MHSAKQTTLDKTALEKRLAVVKDDLATSLDTAQNWVYRRSKCHELPQQTWVYR
jgi:tryptophanyl-tRNA synthetase